MNIRDLEPLFERHELTNYTWIRAEDIVVAQWVRMKCLFGCEGYGASPCCPPNMPSVEECRRFFSEYRHVAVFHFPKRFDDPKEHGGWSRECDQRLSALEREVFLAGWHKAFLLFLGLCYMCPKCTGGTRQECVNRKVSRPTMEAFGVDVYTTVRKYGLPIQVVKDRSDLTNRYAFLMVD